MKRSVVAITLVRLALLGVGIALAAIPQTQAPDKNIVLVAGASIVTSNGTIHVIDTVLLPPAAQ